MPAKLSTHVLDTANGCPARDMMVELWALAGESRRLVASVRTNAEGRTDQPLLGPAEMAPGTYEIIFFVGDYFARRGMSAPGVRFLDVVPLRIGIADAAASYHVPLLCSPWAYSTYRGS